jgi:hypothetical protein
MLWQRAYGGILWGSRRMHKYHNSPFIDKFTKQQSTPSVWREWWKTGKKNCSQQISPVKLDASELLDIKDTGIVYYEKRLHA